MPALVLEPLPTHPAHFARCCHCLVQRPCPTPLRAPSVVVARMRSPSTPFCECIVLSLSCSRGAVLRLADGHVVAGTAGTLAMCPDHASWFGLHLRCLQPIGCRVLEHPLRRQRQLAGGRRPRRLLVRHAPQGLGQHGLPSAGVRAATASPSCSARQEAASLGALRGRPAACC